MLLNNDCLDFTLVLLLGKVDFNKTAVIVGRLDRLCRLFGLAPSRKPGLNVSLIVTGGSYTGAGETGAGLFRTGRFRLFGDGPYNSRVLLNCWFSLRFGNVFAPADTM